MTDEKYERMEAFIVEQERKLRKQFHRMEFGLNYLLNPAKGMEPYHRQKNIWLWECAREHIWGEALLPPARNLWLAVRNIYGLDPAGESLPLAQAIRLLDVYQLLRGQLSRVETRLSGGSSAWGGARAKSPRYVASGDARETLESARAELKSSCARLEAIIADVQATLQEQRRRHAPGRVRGETSGEAVAGSEIQARVAREIETYSRLERETEPHLR